LVGRARHDRATVGPHLLGEARFPNLALHHPERRVDVVARQIPATLQLRVEAPQHGGRSLDLGVALALDEDFVATGDDADRQLLLDPRDIDMVLAEQRCAGGVVVEPDAMARALEVGERCYGCQANIS
jgi:hypothetical protein